MDNGLSLQQEVVRLQALLETSRKVHGTIHMDELLHCVLEIAVKELELDGAFFERGEALESATCMHYGEIPSEMRGPVDIAGVPLLDKKGQTLTHLMVMRAGNPLSMEEQDFLEGLALQAAVAIENARHHERLLAWGRMQKDLAAARAIQRSLLPQSIPAIPGYEADFRSTTCYEVGGDYVDVLPEGNGKFMMMVADVAGKGLASALVAASFRAAFRGMVAAGLAPVDLANRMSALHYGEGPEARRRYVTAILFRLDAVRHEVELVNAGHNPGLIISADGECRVVDASGPPLGILPGIEYTAERHAFEPGARLLFYTDGLTEVFQGDEEFGMERLIDLARECRGDGCGAMLERIWTELTKFSGTTATTDDMTALAVLRTGNGDR